MKKEGTKTGSHHKGFTLIELLVVVAVIGILASVILIGLGSVRGKGRDARRIADLKQLQNGLELFFNACSRYPATLDGLVTDDATCISGAPGGIGINQLSKDPTGPGYGYCLPVGVTNRYVLGAILEDPNNQALVAQGGAWPCDPKADGGTGASMVCSNGAVGTAYCATI